jgi:hypothetical protein
MGLLQAKLHALQQAEHYQLEALEAEREALKELSLVPQISEMAKRLHRQRGASEVVWERLQDTTLAHARKQQVSCTSVHTPAL